MSSDRDTRRDDPPLASGAQFWLDVMIVGGGLGAGWWLLDMIRLTFSAWIE
jgi:hypothetical protein